MTSQRKRPMTTTRTYTLGITGMHCSSCALLIDETVESIAGVTRATTHLRQGNCVVELDPTRTNPKLVVKAIKKLGYRVTLTE